MRSTPSSGRSVRTSCTPRATTLRASMSRPESVSSRTAKSGSRIAICKISLRFFSPPEKPSLRYRSPKAGSMSRRFIHSMIANRSSSTDRSTPLRAERAWPWTSAGEGPMLGTAGAITLVEGSAFAISGRSGDMVPNLPQGLFFRDTRFLSRLELRVNGQAPEALEAEALDPFSATFALRTRPRPGRADSPLLLFRHRFVGRGMREDLVVRNYGEEPAYCSIEILFEADFADLFQVKAGHFETEGEAKLESGDGEIVFRYQRGAIRRGVRISFSEPAEVAENLASFEVIVPAQGSWQAR